MGICDLGLSRRRKKRETDVESALLRSRSCRPGPLQRNRTAHSPGAPISVTKKKGSPSPSPPPPPPGLSPLTLFDSGASIPGPHRQKRYPGESDEKGDAQTLRPILEYAPCSPCAASEQGPQHVVLRGVGGKSPTPLIYLHQPTAFLGDLLFVLALPPPSRMKARSQGAVRANLNRLPAPITRKGPFKPSDDSGKCLASLVCHSPLPFFYWAQPAFPAATIFFF